MKLATILSYCSNDQQFLYENLSVLTKFSDKVVLPLLSHFWNGEEEIPNFFEDTRTFCAENFGDKVEVITYTATVEEVKAQRSWYWESFTRQLALDHIKNHKPEYVLMVDADEIFEVEEMQRWLQNLFTQETVPWDTIDFTSYYYYRTPKIRDANYMQGKLCFGKLFKFSSLLVGDPEKLTTVNLFNYEGRPVIGVKGVAARKDDGSPFLHHFSYVRNKEQMKKKLKTFGHNGDKNWDALVEEEFSHEFDGTTFASPEAQFEFLHDDGTWALLERDKNFFLTVNPSISYWAASHKHKASIHFKKFFFKKEYFMAVVTFGKANDNGQNEVGAGLGTHIILKSVRESLSFLPIDKKTFLREVLYKTCEKTGVFINWLSTTQTDILYFIRNLFSFSFGVVIISNDETFVFSYGDVCSIVNNMTVISAFEIHPDVGVLQIPCLLTQYPKFLGKITEVACLPTKDVKQIIISQPHDKHHQLFLDEVATNSLPIETICNKHKMNILETAALLKISL